jgi:hypothetical protein
VFSIERRRRSRFVIVLAASDGFIIILASVSTIIMWQRVSMSMQQHTEVGAAVQIQHLRELAFRALFESG